MVTGATQQDYMQKYAQIVGKAWSDPAFRQRLMTDTRVVLQENGIEVPDGVQVQAVENTERVMYLPLAPQPRSELSDEQLEQVAGGATASTAASAGTVGTLCGLTAGTMGSAGSASTM